LKTKIENKKFTLEKFEVAKLKNMKVIKGGSEYGGGGDWTITDKTLRQSTGDCN
jgi:hypothetical protein